MTLEQEVGHVLGAAAHLKYAKHQKLHGGVPWGELSEDEKEIWRQAVLRDLREGWDQ